jgi:hypothetical protein
LAQGSFGGGWGGGVSTTDLEPTSISDCVFIGNRAGAVGRGSAGGAVGASSINTVVERCTMIGNSSGVDNGVVRTSIIAFSTEGPACDAEARVYCTALFGNTLGDTIPGVDGGGNFVADPQFCAVDPAVSRNPAIQSDSPCANAPGCGQIGAAPVGCDSVSIERTPWSRVKGLYRR